MSAFDHVTDKPCSRCEALYEAGRINGEMVMPLPEGVRAPYAIDGSGKCCYDCASADTLIKLGLVIKARPGDKDWSTAFEMARIAVGNDRVDQLRMPGMPMGLVNRGYVRPCADGDLERHHKWLDEHNFEIDVKPIGLTWNSPEVRNRWPSAGADWDAFVARERPDLTGARVVLKIGTQTWHNWASWLWLAIDGDPLTDWFRYRSDGFDLRYLRPGVLVRSRHEHKDYKHERFTWVSEVPL